MELTVQIENKKMYDSFLQFFKVLNITVSEKISYHDKKNNQKLKYPLSGTVIKYDNPFGPSTDTSDWEVTK